MKSQLGLVDNCDVKNGEVNAEIAMREQLLGLRHRNTEKPPDVDLDQLITHQQSIQEKIANDMLMLAQNLKGQSELANKIIRKDNEVRFRDKLLQFFF